MAKLPQLKVKNNINIRKELIRTNENDLLRWEQKRDDLRNKVKFCSDHKFEEEVRISLAKLQDMEGIIYDYQQFLKDLKIIVKSYENGSKKTES